LLLNHPQSLLYYLGSNAAGYFSPINGDYTFGGRFLVLYPSTIIQGLEFYTAIAGVHSIKGSLWDPSGALVASATKVCNGTGQYQCLFSSPYSVSSSQFALQSETGSKFWYFGIYETTGTYYTRLNDQYDYIWCQAGYGDTQAFQRVGAVSPCGRWPGKTSLRADGDACPIGHTDRARSVELIATYELEIYDLTSPTIALISPVNGSTSNSVNSSITINVTDTGAGVNIAATNIYIEGVLAWTLDSIQSGFSGSRSSIADGYQYVISRTVAFDPAQVVNIIVEAQDMSSNSSTESYSFACISIGDFTHSFEVIAITSASVEFPTRNFWNEFDEHGAIASVKRNKGEKNFQYRRRIRDRFANTQNASTSGLIHSITSDLGLTLSNTLFINPRVDSNNEFIPPDPYILFEGAYLYLYSDYSNDILDYKIDRFESGGNYEYLNQLVQLVNTTVNFESHIEPGIDIYTRSMCLFDQSNRVDIDNELIELSSKFKLKNRRIVAGSVYFSNRDIFRTEVDNEIEVNQFGKYWIDYRLGIVRVFSIPLSKTTVRYSYVVYPYIAKTSPIILYDINSSGFKPKLFQQILQDDGTYIDGLPTRLGVDIINELLTVRGGIYFGK
jgi:hypothetical protein